jgi:hypothetical protein
MHIGTPSVRALETHLPFILLADKGVKSDDSAMPEIASNRIAGSLFMSDLFD